VAILDVRLRTRSYGRKFLRALPKAPLVTTLEDVEAFFATFEKGADARYS
jgi:Rad3-related DNA helicase